MTSSYKTGIGYVETVCQRCGWRWSCRDKCTFQQETVPKCWNTHSATNNTLWQSCETSREANPVNTLCKYTEVEEHSAVSLTTIDQRMCLLACIHMTFIVWRPCVLVSSTKHYVALAQGGVWSSVSRGFCSTSPLPPPPPPTLHFLSPSRVVFLTLPQWLRRSPRREPYCQCILQRWVRLCTGQWFVGLLVHSVSFSGFRQEKPRALISAGPIGHPRLRSTQTMLISVSVDSFIRQCSNKQVRSHPHIRPHSNESRSPQWVVTPSVTRVLSGSSSRSG